MTARIRSTMQDDFPLTIPFILRHALACHGPTRVAAVTAQGLEGHTIAQTAERIHRLTGGLIGLGVQPGEAVATFCWNNQPHLEAYFAVPATGAVLHTINLRLFADQIAWIINDAQDRFLLLDASNWETILPVLPQCPSLERLILAEAPEDFDTSASPIPVTRYEELLTADPVIADVEDERAAAVMCYTSGTTGNPKGVVYSHRSVYLHAAANLFAGGFGLSDRDVVLQVVPMFHANGWGFPYAAFLAGAGLVLPGRDLSPAALVPLIEAERTTLSGGVPTVWRGVFDWAAEHGRDISSLRVISCAGSAVPESLLRDYVGLGIEMYQAWGMTETSPLAAIARPPHNDRGRDEWYWRTRTGLPVPGVEIRVVDEDGAVLPADGESVGEFEVRGPWVVDGYFAGRSQDRFDGGWLRTGDVGRLDDAVALKITDRSKDLIKSGGEWISSTEVEDLLSAVPGVVDAACIGISDEKWGERPLGLITVRAGSAVTMGQVRDKLLGTLAKWQLPERVLVVDAIARTGVGKIDKQALRAAQEAGELTGQPLAD